jgi:hypothetical protein
MSATIEFRHRQIALFFTMVALLLAVALHALRTGIGTDAALLAKIAAVTVFSLNAPLLHRLGLPSEPTFTGIRMLLVLMIGIAVIQLGPIGIVTLEVAAVASLALNLLAVMRKKTLVSRLLAVLGLAVLATTAIFADFASTKYANVLSDQLVLYGRADGDVLIHSALINALRYFAEPSAGIDGIALTRYHFGTHVVVALLANDDAMSAVLAFSIFKAVLLYALAFCAALQCATLLRPATARSPSLLLLLVIALLVAVIPPVETGYLAAANSETAMFSGFIIFALLPSFHSILTDPTAGRPQQVRALIIAACLIVPLSLFKLSAGYTWASAVFVWSLIAFGWRERATWVAWVLAGIGGAFSLYLFTLTGQGEMSGTSFETKLFGTPYFIEYGFQKGDYLLPVTLNVASLLVLALYVWRRWRSGARRASPWTDADLRFIAVTLVFANLPGLLLDIDSGNAGHFIVQQNLLALPFLVAALVAPVEDGLVAGRVSGRWRTAGALAAAVIVVAGLYGAGKKWVADTRAFIAQRALINTADDDYYRSTRKRDLKADASRYLDAAGLVSLLKEVTPPPPAASLAKALADARSEFGQELAAYVAPGIGSYWALTSDCDAKSLFTMAAAGVPLVNGYPPCQPKFVYNGYPPPPRVSALDSAELCLRTQELGFSRVFVIADLASRAEDQILDCASMQGAQLRLFHSAAEPPGGL